MLGEDAAASPSCRPASHLRAQRAVAFEEVGADLCPAGHVDVAVGTVAVAADSFQEVGAHGHLGGQEGSEAEGRPLPPRPLLSPPHRQERRGPTQGSTARHEPHTDCGNKHSAGQQEGPPTLKSDPQPPQKVARAEHVCPHTVQMRILRQGTQPSRLAQAQMCCHLSPSPAPSLPGFQGVGLGWHGPGGGWSRRAGLGGRREAAQGGSSWGVSP